MLLYLGWRRYHQFSLGNSFWIHPLVELFVIRSFFAAWYPVSFFGGRRRLIWDMAAVMISPVLWYHDIVCDVMPWYRVCDVMPWYRVCDVINVMSWYRVCDVMPWYRVCRDVMSWYRVCDVMPWFMISGMWCHAMISGMWWCHVHHDIG